MAEPLPFFRYHPDPIQTGSVAPSEKECRRCRRRRGYIYTLAPYTEEEMEEETLCPWCIADGSAHKTMGAEFVDANGIPDEVPEKAAELLVERTPGYAAFQSEPWRACCDDAAAFLGPFGYREIRPELRQPLMTYFQEEMQYEEDEAVLLLESLSRDEGPTAYVFQCLHCRAYRFHVDFP